VFSMRGAQSFVVMKAAQRGCREVVGFASEWAVKGFTIYAKGFFFSQKKKPTQKTKYHPKVYGEKCLGFS